MTGIQTAQDLRDRCFVDGDGCWHWRGAMSRDDSPAVWIPVLGCAGSLSMLTGLLKTGKRTGKNDCWYPTCPTPNCANPAHRKLMTRSAMMKIVRAISDPLHRAKVTRGKRAASKVMNMGKADEIRASDEMGTELSKRLGVSVSIVSRVRRGEAWRQSTYSAFSQL